MRAVTGKKSYALIMGQIGLGSQYTDGKPWKEYKLKNGQCGFRIKKHTLQLISKRDEGEGQWERKMLYHLSKSHKQTDAQFSLRFPSRYKL